MTASPEAAIAQILIDNLPRNLILGIEEAVHVGATRAYGASAGMHNGHLPNVLGQLRHFHINETFHEALAAGGASPTPIKGNGVVTGTAGILTLGRFNTSTGVWNTARRSSKRKQLAQANRAIQTLVQPDLFGGPLPVTTATVFFVGVFSGSLKIQPESPLAVEIAVPDKELKNWIFRESVGLFLARYERGAAQPDTAQPRLKRNIDKKPGPL